MAMSARLIGLFIQTAHQYVFDFNVFFNAIVASFPTIAGVFYPAKWNRSCPHGAAVKNHHPRLDSPRQAERSREVSREGIGNQTIFGVVRALQYFVFSLEPVDREHGAKNFCF